MLSPPVTTSMRPYTDAPYTTPVNPQSSIVPGYNMPSTSLGQRHVEYIKNGPSMPYTAQYNVGMDTVQRTYHDGDILSSQPYISPVDNTMSTQQYSANVYNSSVQQPTPLYTGVSITAQPQLPEFASEMQMCDFYLRFGLGTAANMCFKGNTCKYYHPPQIAPNGIITHEICKAYLSDYGCVNHSSCSKLHPCGRISPQFAARIGIRHLHFNPNLNASRVNLRAELPLHQLNDLAIVERAAEPPIGLLPTSTANGGYIHRDPITRLPLPTPIPSSSTATTSGGVLSTAHTVNLNNNTSNHHRSSNNTSSSFGNTNMNNTNMNLRSSTAIIPQQQQQQQYNSTIIPSHQRLPSAIISNTAPVSVLQSHSQSSYSTQSTSLPSHVSGHNSNNSRVHIVPPSTVLPSHGPIPSISNYQHQSNNNNSILHQQQPQHHSQPLLNSTMSNHHIIGNGNHNNNGTMLKISPQSTLHNLLPPPPPSASSSSLLTVPPPPPPPSVVLAVSPSATTTTVAPVMSTATSPYNPIIVPAAHRPSTTMVTLPLSSSTITPSTTLVVPRPSQQLQSQQSSLSSSNVVDDSAYLTPEQALQFQMHLEAAKQLQEQRQQQQQLSQHQSVYSNSIVPLQLQQQQKQQHQTDYNNTNTNTNIDHTSSFQQQQRLLIHPSLPVLSSSIQDTPSHHNVTAPLGSQHHHTTTSSSVLIPPPSARIPQNQSYSASHHTSTGQSSNPSLMSYPPPPPSSHDYNVLQSQQQQKYNHISHYTTDATTSPRDGSLSPPSRPPLYDTVSNSMTSSAPTTTAPPSLHDIAIVPLSPDLSPSSPENDDLIQASATTTDNNSITTTTAASMGIQLHSSSQVSSSSSSHRPRSVEPHQHKTSYPTVLQVDSYSPHSIIPLNIARGSSGSVHHHNISSHRDTTSGSSDGSISISPRHINHTDNNVTQQQLQYNNKQYIDMNIPNSNINGQYAQHQYNNNNISQDSQQQQQQQMTNTNNIHINYMLQQPQQSQQYISSQQQHIMIPPPPPPPDTLACLQQQQPQSHQHNHVPYQQSQMTDAQLYSELQLQQQQLLLQQQQLRQQQSQQQQQQLRHNNNNTNGGIMMSSSSNMVPAGIYNNTNNNTSSPDYNINSLNSAFIDMSLTPQYAVSTTTAMPPNTTSTTGGRIGVISIPPPPPPQSLMNTNNTQQQYMYSNNTNIYTQQQQPHIGRSQYIQ